MKPAVYLDFNATAPIRDEAVEAITQAFRTGGNASSVHSFGRAARRLLEDGREQVAALVGVSGDDVLLTGGGTEANNLALLGCGRPNVIVSAVEHPSVLAVRGGNEPIPVDGDGIIDLAALEARLAAQSGEAVVSVMLANNETGVLQPVGKVSEIAKRHGALVHCDAVQAAGKIAVDMRALGVDMLSLAAHKIGGPQGIGALIVGPEVPLSPQIRGGGQERRRRAGTENIAGAAGFGAAASAALAGLSNFAKLAGLRDRMEEAVLSVASDAKMFGRTMMRLPNTSCFAVPNLPSDTQVMALDMEGVAISSGSACSSGKVEASHVLAAMGEHELGVNTIRVSLGWTSGSGDVDRFVEVWRKAYLRNRERAGAEELVAS